MINIKAETARHLRDEFNIDSNVTALLFDNGALSMQACRNMLIREEYRKKACSKERQRVKGCIAERYCISIKSVEKIVLQQHYFNPISFLVNPT